MTTFTMVKLVFLCFMCLLFNAKAGVFGGVKKLSEAERDHVTDVCGTGFNPNEPLLQNQQKFEQIVAPVVSSKAQLKSNGPVLKMQSDLSIPANSKRPWVAMILKTDRKLSKREFKDWLLQRRRDIKFNATRVCGATLVSYKHVVTTAACYLKEISNARPKTNCLIFLGSPVYINGLQDRRRHLYMKKYKSISKNYFSKRKNDLVIIELDRPVDSILQNEGCARPICLVNDYETWSTIARPTGTLLPLYLESYEHKSHPSSSDNDFIKYAVYEPLSSAKSPYVYMFTAYIPGYFDHGTLMQVPAISLRRGRLMQACIT